MRERDTVETVLCKIDLCLERSYDHKVFHDQVTHFKFYDHGVPTLSNMFALCVAVEEFLEKDDDNIVAIHCKGM